MAAPLSIRTTTSLLYIPLICAPQYGKDTRKILVEFGLKSDNLINNRIASIKWSNYYLPYSKECLVCFQCMYDNIIEICKYIPNCT